MGSREESQKLFELRRWVLDLIPDESRVLVLTQDADLWREAWAARLEALDVDFVSPQKVPESNQFQRKEEKDSSPSTQTERDRVVLLDRLDTCEGDQKGLGELEFATPWTMRLSLEEARGRPNRPGEICIYLKSGFFSRPRWQVRIQLPKMNDELAGREFASLIESS